MTLKFSVRDYRGVERADIELAPLALISGNNEQGKSSLAQAARAALAGVPIPIPGIAKKDAAILVREGAEKGEATVSGGGEARTVRWPKADVKDSESAPWCSPFAVGLRHLLDDDGRERANIMAGYVDSVPGITDLAKAMADAGYSEKAVEQTWAALTASPNGWDETWKKAREHTTLLKGQWEATTGEKWGAKKAEDWTPEGLPDDAGRDALEATLERAREAVKEAVGSAAVSAAEVERLRAEAETPAEDVDPLREELTVLEVELEQVQAERAALPADGKSEGTTCECPACGVNLVVDKVWNGPTTLKLPSGKEPTKAELKEIRTKRASLDGKIGNLQARISTLTRQIASAEQAAERALAALTRLQEMDGRKEGVSAEDVAAAERAEAEARAALAAFDAKVQADKIHRNIIKNEKLVAILAPEGLRRRKLAAGLDTFNAALADISAAAKWPVVRIDENLDAHYGTRPVWAASASGQWRARLVIQLAMAQMDGSAAVVIDEADILDFRGRNGLFALLKASGLRALVAMTFNKPDLVPDLAKAKLGASYWISAGVVEPIGQAEEKAA